MEPFKTALTDLLGIRYPIIQGGMAWVAESTLCAAVSEAGGLGLIGAGSAPAEWVKGQIEKVRALTDKPFGVNIMLMSPHADAVAEVVRELRVPVVTTGAGNPAKHIEGWKQNGIKVVPVIPSVALAVRMQRCGADALVAEGTEAGGHIGELTTMALIPQVSEAVTIPVAAAGGIADGRGMAAALMLGAEGVQIGTRFLVASECQIHDVFKQKVIGAKDTDTIVTGRYPGGHAVRSIKNKFTRKMQSLEQEGVDPQEMEALLSGSLNRAVQGIEDEGAFMAGQSAGMVNKCQSAQEIIEDIIADTRRVLAERSRFS